MIWSRCSTRSMHGERRSTSTTQPSHLRPKGSTSQPHSGSLGQASGNQQQKPPTGSTTSISHSPRYRLERVSTRPHTHRNRAAGPELREYSRGGRHRRTRSQQLHSSTERDGRAVATARAAHRQSRLRRMPRRNGHHPESARSRNARVRRTVRTRSIRSGQPRHDHRLRHATHARHANPRDAPGGDQTGNDLTRRRAASRRRLQQCRRRPSGHERPRITARPRRPSTKLSNAAVPTSQESKSSR